MKSVHLGVAVNVMSPQSQEILRKQLRHISGSAPLHGSLRSHYNTATNITIQSLYKYRHHQLMFYPTCMSSLSVSTNKTS